MIAAGSKISWRLIILLPVICQSQPYEPTWDSLDSRPLPNWYDRSKFGIFVHWGVYSVPSFKSEWFWWYWKGPGASQEVVTYANKNYKPNFTYAEFGSMFTAEFFDADEWARVFKKSGAKYIVLTSKHHEGFTMWPSKFSWNWNSVDIGPKRDIVGELSKAVRGNNLTFGLYYSQFEWFHPLYKLDASNNFSTNFYPTTVSLPQMYEIVKAYQPDLLWSDGDAGPDSYWKSKEFLAWLYNQSPVKDSVVVNDRWGYGISCKHGGFFTCDDRYDPGKLQPRKWENCLTIQRHSWGFDRTARLADFLSTRELLELLVETISYGGNFLLNVGPTHDGRIAPLFEERLYEIGQWLQVSGEAIYDTDPWPTCQNDSVTPKLWYTQALKRCVNEAKSREDCQKVSQPFVSTTVYATFFEWPDDGYLHLGCLENTTFGATIYMLGTDLKLKWKRTSTGKPGILVDLLPVTLTYLPSALAWTLMIRT